MAEQKAEAPAATEKISKSEAVKRAFAKLGKAAMPKAVQAEVKKAFGLDVSANHISSIKAELIGKPVAKKPGPKKPAAPAAKVTAVVAKAAPAPATNGKRPVVSIDDVLTLKAIVGRVGASHVKTLVDAMSS